MAYVDWRLRGPELTNCNCSWGCPCQFNALPTNGDCRAMVAMRVDEGHFGDVDLAGTKWIGMFAWPKAIHEGNGEALVVIDEAASEDQRNALLTILSGGETEPGATIFNVFAATFTTMHEPLFLPIEFEADIEERTARVAAPGVIATAAEPIRNPVTAEPQRVSVNMPGGFEYKHAEYCSGDTRATAAIDLDWTGRHAHLTMLDMTAYGVA